MALFTQFAAAENSAAAAEVEHLRRRNAELDREVAERRAREEAMRAEMERVLARLRVAEDAEERLCAQLGELEAEAVAYARACHLRIKELSDLLDIARRSASSSSSSSSLCSLSD